MISGGYILTKEPITCNDDKQKRIINVVNYGTDTVSSVEVGKLTNLMLLDPSFFRIEPKLIIKSG